MEDFQILVVEDSEPLRHLLAETLKGIGFRVAAAPSAEEGLRIFDSEDVDLVVTDIELPGKSGLDLLGEVKERRPETEVVIMTGSPSPESILAALRGGACDYLIKPFKAFSDFPLAVCRAAEKIRRRSEDR